MRIEPGKTYLFTSQEDCLNYGIEISKQGYLVSFERDGELYCVRVSEDEPMLSNKYNKYYSMDSEQRIKAWTEEHKKYYENSGAMYVSIPLAVYLRIIDRIKQAYGSCLFIEEEISDRDKENDEYTLPEKEWLLFLKKEMFDNQELLYRSLLELNAAHDKPEEE